jgi:predicted TIM-barrel fold metal-dependent hydrolase
MSDQTIVDIYCHIAPEKFFQEMNRIAPRLGNIAARLRGVKKLFDLDERFREMDQFGDYRQIISLPNPPIEDLATGEVGLNLARIGNDAMAELCARHPQRFPTFVAALSLTDVAGSVAEARRAVKELGADLRHHGRARSADLAPSGAHREHDRLSRGAEVALRDVVVLRLAL